MNQTALLLEISGSSASMQTGSSGFGSQKPPIIRGLPPPVSFIPQTDPLRRNGGAKAPIVFGNPLMGLIVVILLEPGIPVVVQLFQRPHLVGFDLGQKGVYKIKKILPCQFPLICRLRPESVSQQRLVPVLPGAPYHL